MKASLIEHNNYMHCFDAILRCLFALFRFRLLHYSDSAFKERQIFPARDLRIQKLTKAGAYIAEKLASLKVTATFAF